jgi:acyl transferase domain-containing protein/acyl carrier protein
MNDSEILESLDGSEIAVIGLACRFPGAKNYEVFWQNLCDGVESITFLKDEEIQPSLIDPGAPGDPNYVKAAPLLEDVDLFDAAFFDLTPREAEVMDPQHRLFLECAWQAMENAGYDPLAYKKAVGLFAGARTDTYIFNLFSSRNSMPSLGAFEIGLGNDLAFLSTRVSYKLNLRGPSYSVHTACSTSLVAVHLACQSLLIDECQMALAGGIAINVPQKAGYIYYPGSYASPDGHTRTFDVKAAGTIFGSGLGVVVLKRLADAITDGDSIHAVVKGSAINNDGTLKATFTAPGVNGQRDVIVEAMAAAGVAPETISYIEAHGTATALGDSIEIRALKKAFNDASNQEKSCALGSVKTNIGHLDAAAGVAGFIKTVLALKHKLLPPSLNFQEPNPNLDLENSLFYVNTRLAEWEPRATPRRAGVSAFGVGGTNAHVIVEESPAVEPSGPSRPWQLLLLSAKTESALETATANLSEFLKERQDANLADVAFTLKLGRRPFSHRRMLVCRDLHEAAGLLESPNPQQVFTGELETIDRPVIFMFPGGGAQYANMGRELYELEPDFRREVDACVEILKAHAGYDLSDFMFPAAEDTQQAAEKLKNTSVALPALFVIEYALARLWISWGIRPEAMIGHSLGEYVAACLAGVFSLEDALSLVVYRGKLIEELPKGAMLSVPLPEDELRPLMSERLAIAAINAPSQCVVSGPIDAIEQIEGSLGKRGIEFRRLQISVAGHSEVVAPVLGDFTSFIRTLELKEPAMAYISNVTGTWIKSEEATDPVYWGKHLRQTVRFGEGLNELLKETNRILLEVGPGQTLTTLAKMQAGASRAQSVMPSMRHPLDKQPDEATLLTTVGRLWLMGAQIDWSSFYAHERRHRIALPTYPFERQRYWIDPADDASNGQSRQANLAKQVDISNWFYIPSWTRRLPPKPFRPGGDKEGQASWLVMVDESGFGAQVVERLKAEQQKVFSVRAGEKFERIAEASYSINTRMPEDYESLLKELRASGKMPTRVVHAWSLTSGRQQKSDAASFKKSQENGYYSLLFFAKALSKEQAESINIGVVSNYLHEVSGDEPISPEKATMLGPCKVIPQESPNVGCCSIDIILPESGSREEARLIDHILSEINTDDLEVAVAYRGNRRWAQKFEPVSLRADDDPIRPLRENGVYLITGGLGGVGLLLADYLARTLRARLILTRHSHFPDRDEWEDWLATHDEGDTISRKILKLQALQQHGATLDIISADVSDERQMQSLIDRVYDKFGQLNGVLHAAGVTSGASVYKPYAEIGYDESEMQFQPKGYGLYVLEKVLSGRGVDFCLLFSSNASTLGGLGFITYSASNQFMDAFAASRNRLSDTAWISANWDPWPEETKRYSGFQTNVDQYTMTPEESEEAFRRIVSMSDGGQIAVGTGDLPARIAIYVKRDTGPDAPASKHPRPAIKSTYVAPANDAERVVAEIWQQILGIDNVGRNDNFFDLGGHSLLATRVISHLREAFQINLPVGKLFEAPTVASLAEVIADIHAEQEDSEKIEILKMLAELSEDEVDAEINRRADTTL